MKVGISSEESLSIHQLAQGRLPKDSNFLHQSCESVNLKYRMINNALRSYQAVHAKLTADFAVSKPLGLSLEIYREFP